MVDPDRQSLFDLIVAFVIIAAIWIIFHLLLPWSCS
jgi:hypothetical protein